GALTRPAAHKHPGRFFHDGAVPTDLSAPERDAPPAGLWNPGLGSDWIGDLTSGAWIRSGGAADPVDPIERTMDPTGTTARVQRLTVLVAIVLVAVAVGF